MSRVDVCLKNFFIFNTNISYEEGEEEKKVLFYYPENVNSDRKINDVGFSEAVLKFTNSFTKDDSCYSLHTQKTSHLYFQPEKDYWIVMTLNVPYDVKTKDHTEYHEYKGDDVLDSVYQAVLKQSYKMFRLFMGTFEANYVGGTDIERIRNLKSKLDQFYFKYVLTLNIKSSDILDVFQSVQYFPLNQLLFLRVHNFIQMIESTFPIVKHTLFLYNEQVVWSGINPDDLYSIHEFMVGTLFPKALSNELQGASDIPKRYSFTSNSYGNFITGLESIENCIKAPKIFVYVDGEAKEYYFVVYKALSAIICLFVDSSDYEMTEELFAELHSFIGPQLVTLASAIGENYANGTVQSEQEAGPKYLYFNELDYQHKGTIHVNNRLMKNSNIPSEIMNVLVDLFDSRQASHPSTQTEETTVKTLSDYWIVRRVSNSRHFYVIVNKTTTLLEVTDEAKKMFDQHLRDVYFVKH